MMGEYIGTGARQIKIGTCEDLYYARITDLKKWSPQSEVREYLNPNNGFRYRFPFPEEDGTRIGHYEPFEKGLLILLNDRAPKVSALLRSPDWEHHHICHSASYHGICNVNVMINCPLSANPPERMSIGGPSVAVVLEQQKQVDGKLWVVVSCPYCQSKVRLDEEGGMELVAVLRNYTDDDQRPYYHEIANRIEAGYSQV